MISKLIPEPDSYKADDAIDTLALNASIRLKFGQILR